jgi:hypothetical protein
MLGKEDVEKKTENVTKPSNIVDVKKVRVIYVVCFQSKTKLQMTQDAQNLIFFETITGRQ